jgi:hypothetical protein
MRVKTISFLLATAIAAAAAAGCGDDSPAADAGADASGDDDDDAGVDAAVVPACAEFDAPVGTISSFPGTFDGDLMGKGSNINVGATTCTDTRDYWAPVGEDEVVELTGLTVDAAYVITLTSADDLSFYVATGCDEAAGGPASGACLLFADQSASTTEQAEFRATATSVFVVIDNFSTSLLADGTYTLDVFEADCVVDDDCDVTAPACLDYVCVECASSFDCPTAGEPACDFETNTCAISFDECTGDDVNEPDDGPLTATSLVAPGGAPTTVIGAICSVPASEGDWYSVVLPDDGRLQVSLAWTGTPDLDVILFDDLGVVQGFGAGSANPERFAVFDLPAGTYFLQVYQYSPVEAAAVTYTLTLAIPECQTVFDCELGTAPICDGATNTCVEGVNTCTGDDDIAELAGDDGPAGATPIVVAPGATTMVDSAVCSQPASELDFFQVVVADGEGLDASVSWTGATIDLDLYIFDAIGRQVALSYWQMPESVTTTLLPAGTYYLAVQKFGAADAVSVDYTLSVTRTDAQTCTTVADCATEHITQFFRGDCTGDGACAFLEGNGETTLGDACDSDDDCASGPCTYLLFESDADLSVCGVACADDAACTDALGAGYSCTTPFEVNFCTPDCDSNLECGANLGSSELDADLPWNFLTCTDGACTP